MTTPIGSARPERLNQGGDYDPRSGHLVQFYEQETFLYSAVADFLTEGLQAGEPLLVIATPGHTAGFARELKSRGIDIEAETIRRRVTMLDARETLARFMAGNMPDDHRFRTAIGGAIDASRSGDRAQVRAYGEMVDLLWRDGNPEGAIRVEELWNELADDRFFSLLCAYPMGNFYKETATPQFERICTHHGVIRPAESFSSSEADGRAREICLLQQRAGALAAEIEHRKELEKALRAALGARQTAEDALRRSERELRDFIENATIGLHWVGPDGRILWANEAELKLLGYTRQEYIGRHIAEFHADPVAISDILRRLGDNQELRDYEAALTAKDGSIKHVAISSNALFENGRLIRTRCFTRDITDRKRVEEDNAFLLEASTVLNRSLDYDAKLRELAALIVPRLADWCVIDLATGLEHYDRAIVTHIDPSKSALISGKRLPGIRESDPVRVALTTNRRQMFERLSDDQLEPWATDADHLDDLRKLRTRSMIVVPMKLNERIIGAVTLGVSDSGRTYTHADLALATELARRAAVALENARLYHLAQDANRTKDEFLATLSHELRTPLTAILGWARLLTMGGLDAATSHAAFETIERSARTQASLVDDLLDLSRIVTGKLTLQSDLVDLSAIIQRAVQTLGLAAEAKNIRFDISGTDERTIVAGDPTRLQQLVWNLLSNAIKFSAPGSQVAIALDRMVDASRIVVCDAGRGIPLEFLPHVFEPFRQADGGTTRSHSGLGLGLAIVKYLTELHGGTVMASSEGPNRGATFTVTLPSMARTTQQNVPLAAIDEITDLSGVRVLLVDDDADTRDLVTAILRRCGADVESAASVSDACHQLTLKRPDVVVSDIAMPGQDGYAMLLHVRAGDDRTRPVPVVALTAMSHPESSEQLRAAGFQASVQKPIDPVEFARVIARVHVK